MLIQTLFNVYISHLSFTRAQFYWNKTDIPYNHKSINTNSASLAIFVPKKINAQWLYQPLWLSHQIAIHKQ